MNRHHFLKKSGYGLGVISIHGMAGPSMIYDSDVNYMKQKFSPLAITMSDAIAINSFCGPQFRGIFRNIRWHKELTASIRNSGVSQDIQKSSLQTELLKFLRLTRLHGITSN
jgi:hypothetical protein